MTWGTMARMTRIIAGSAGGRRLDVPPGRGTRPTSDRAREGIFSTIGSLQGLDGARVMDLYAGSGAVGLEALSRGAESAVLVESDAKAVRTIRANVASLGLSGATVVGDRVERFLAKPGSRRTSSSPTRPTPSPTTTSRPCWNCCATTGGWPRTRWSPSSGSHAARTSCGLRDTLRRGSVVMAKRPFGTVAPPGTRRPGRRLASRCLPGVVRPHHQRTS